MAKRLTKKSPAAPTSVWDVVDKAVHGGWPTTFRLCLIAATVAVAATIGTQALDWLHSLVRAVS